MFTDYINIIILPLLFILFGLFLFKFQPKTINWMYGYRTFRSMKSQEAWDFANRYSAKLLLYTGFKVLVISVIFIGFYNGDVEAIEDLQDIIIPLQLVTLIGGTIIPTEVQLRRRFDKDGKPK